MWPSTIAIEDVSDPVEVNRHRESREHFARNSKWLQEHWNDVLPRARGRFIAVAGEEAFIADTGETAWQWVAEQHSEDKGPLVQFVLPSEGPRVYAHSWHVAEVR